jgi:hypothetical protein
MYLPTPDGQFRLDRRDDGWTWQPINRFATAEAALAHVRADGLYRLTDLHTDETVSVRQQPGRPGVLTMTNSDGRTAFLRKPGTVPALGLNRKPLERGFAVNPATSGQRVPTIDGADDPAFTELLDVARRGVTMNAANRTEVA